MTGTALLLIAVDFHFQTQAADGRMDSMTAAFGYAAIAAYLALRERRWLAAVAVSQALAAAAVFTHPNGALLALLLAVTTLVLDRKRIGIAAIAVAALPYLAIGAGWGLYIAQDPGAFRAQLLGNAAGRGPTITTPLAALQMEIVHRYLYNFGLAPWTSASGRLNLVPLLILLAGTALCFAVSEIRRHPGYRLILIWTAITAVYLTWFEGLKTLYYLIYLTPLYSVLCAAAAGLAVGAAAAGARARRRRSRAAGPAAGSAHHRDCGAAPPADYVRSGGPLPARTLHSRDLHHGRRQPDVRACVPAGTCCTISTSATTPGSGPT